MRSTKRWLFGVLLALLAPLTPLAQAGEVRAAVAANFTAPMQQIAPLFEQASGHKVRLSFGSTGKFYAQIRNGAPYDVFVAADSRTPQRLDGDGLTVPGSRFVYALGKLVLWSPQPGMVDVRGEVLHKGGFSKLAIGEPKLAVYGTAAQETLEKLGLWEALLPRLVRGENITQAYQFAASGNAELGFVALSQIAKGGKVGEGSWWIVPSHYYKPIEQSAVQLSGARDGQAAGAFLDFIKGPQAAAIIRSYGYELPDKR
jgi:molybdate transport system substrate-binding protein